MRPSNHALITVVRHPRSRDWREWATGLSFAVLLLLLTTASACGNSATVSDSQVKTDLVGQRFAVGITNFSMEPILWTVEPNQLRDFRVTSRQTDRAAGTDVIWADVFLEGATQAVRGNLKIEYKRFDQGWSLQKVGFQTKPTITSKGSAG